MPSDFFLISYASRRRPQMSTLSTVPPPERTTPRNCSSDGLVPQMSAALGAPFDPIAAVLRVAASAAADDQTTNPELQQSSFYDLAGPKNQFGNPLFLPYMKLVGEGQASVSNTHLRGTVGAFRVVDAGAGATYRLTGTVPLRWMLARIR